MNKFVVTLEYETEADMTEDEISVFICRMLDEVANEVKVTNIVQVRDNK